MINNTGTIKTSKSTGKIRGWLSFVFTIVCVLDTFGRLWGGHILLELNSGRFLKDMPVAQNNLSSIPSRQNHLRQGSDVLCQGHC